MNEVLKTISDRRSIRAYDPTPIPEADLQAIMTAALEAPTARNLQPWHFSVVTNRALLDEFDDALNPEKSVTYKAPAVIFITAPVDRSFFVKVDCGIAVQNMALAAWSLGYGSVILGMPRMVFTGEKAAYFNEKFEIPEGHEFIIALSVGKALASKDAHEQHPEKISYIR
ncbi:MAG: nitroreductase [Clostridia bacterium]|nr:nitroreductase [Clostridia bacterium]